MAYLINRKQNICIKFFSTLRPHCTVNRFESQSFNSSWWVCLERYVGISIIKTEPQWSHPHTLQGQGHNVKNSLQTHGSMNKFKVFSFFFQISYCSNEWMTILLAEQSIMKAWLIIDWSAIHLKLQRIDWQIDWQLSRRIVSLLAVHLIFMTTFPLRFICFYLTKNWFAASRVIYAP